MWRARYGNMDALMMAEMKTVHEENRRLKKLYGERAPD
jgi:putative transposase